MPQLLAGRYPILKPTDHPYTPAELYLWTLHQLTPEQQQEHILGVDAPTSLTVFPHLLSPERLEWCATRAPATALLVARDFLPPWLLQWCEQAEGVKAALNRLAPED